MSNTPPPILALDVDGVVIDGWPKRRWDTNLENDLGIRPDDFQSKVVKRVWDKVLKGELPLFEVLERFLDEHSDGVTPDQFLTYWFENDGPVVEEVVSAALEWQERTGGRLVLATNQEPLRARFIWEDCALRDHFEEMIVSCELGAAKPQPSYFQKADLQLERASGQTIFFLDDHEGNVHAADLHGWQAYHVPDISKGAKTILQISAV